MLDQATKLRNLVLRASRQAALTTGPAPQLIVLAGGKGGVGTTTLALNLSVALAQNASRVVLVDADLQRADMAVLCGLQEEGSIADVLSSRRDLHEILQRGPAGVLVAPGVWADEGYNNTSERSLTRLMYQLRSLGRHADVVVVDAGAGANPISRRFWQAADRVLLVTTPDPVAVMDSYAAIKVMQAVGELPALEILVNRADDEASARDVWTRIDQSCRRFLQCQVDYRGHVAVDPSVPQAATDAIPFLMKTPASPAAGNIQSIVPGLLGQNPTSSSPANSAA